MKKIEITVEPSCSDRLLSLLNQMNLVFTSSKVNIGVEVCDFLSVLVPDEFVDELIEQISENVDLRRRENMISIIEVEGFVSTHLDRFKEKAVKINPAPNPIERLVETTDRYTRLNKDILMFVIFATVIALAGLFLDNVAVVIGAMLLSPLLGPINAFAVNANLGRVRHIIRSQQASLTLLAIVMTTASIITFLAVQLVSLPMTNQILLRSQPGLIDVFLAIILGCAAGLALVTNFAEVLVGVAVAVALVPPATVTGIGLALGDLGLAVGAFLLSIINLLGLQLGSTIILNLKGVTPRRIYQKSMARRYYRYFIYLIMLVLVLVIIILFRH